MTEPTTERQLAETLAETFDQFESPETRQARWENAALAAGREVDRNALRAYLAVADAELVKAASDWANAMSASAAKIRRLNARVRELERPAVEAQRAEIRQSFTELIAQAEQDRDFEGAFEAGYQLRDREEQWAREDASPLDLKILGDGTGL
ncbi:hypothetical protein TPA0906_66140 [Streptomyces olivaceus]|uniref:hypothetical protein n=1 Tax=Streptomyces olivaceus TaxID=47716 RepID=UPI0022EFCFCC|nr:hypothetical protein [Streptomyces olivaceus]GHJ04749.1 hypothetical protein TPA0906_66140 [Streptomyces olivaceus]